MLTDPRVARVRDVVRRVAREGPRPTAARAAQRAAERWRAPGVEVLLPDDVADSTALDLPPGRTLPEGRPGRIGWVCSPPAPGSGGHTTLFRMVEELESRGHECVIFLYDAYGGDLDRHTRVLRRHWPRLRASVRDARRGIDRVDACVASSWESAHVLARRGRTPMHRLYFIQDYEPYFYPRGTHYALAEDSYRFGFDHLALGGAVAELLDAEVGASSQVVPFGCDTDTYRVREPATTRRGVVFFARPSVPRRGFALGALALAEFHRLRPDQEIHVYGDRPPPLDLPTTFHGRLPPVALDALYNRTLGGLALSFTNVTLVADEMLASGAIPVANRNAHAHGTAPNPHLVWADPTPSSLARALAAVVDHPDPAGRARAASASVAVPWASGRARAAELIEARLRGISRPSSSCSASAGT